MLAVSFYRLTLHFTRMSIINDEKVDAEALFLYTIYKGYKLEKGLENGLCCFRPSCSILSCAVSIRTVSFSLSPSGIFRAGVASCIMGPVFSICILSCTDMMCTLSRSTMSAFSTQPTVEVSLRYSISICVGEYPLLERPGECARFSWCLPISCSCCSRSFRMRIVSCCKFEKDCFGLLRNKELRPCVTHFWYGTCLLSRQPRCCLLTSRSSEGRSE